MTNKIPCPACGEPNYETSPACWKCGGTLRVADAPQPVPVEPVVPPPEPEPQAPSPLPSNPPNPESRILNPEPKPAEREAQALHDKEYVTPPVDIEERPHGLGEWLAYAWAAIAGSGKAFKSALDDYDARRGVKSGSASSYSCVVAMLICAAGIVIIVAVVSALARRG